MKHNPQAITTAMQLYFSGESLRNTQKSLRLLGVQVCHRTVFQWIKKYCSLMQAYAEQIKPNVSDVWRGDEIYMKIRGKQKYLFALMDDETRYLIAQEVANRKEQHDAKRLFRHAKESMGKSPIRLITDGLGSYQNAYESEFKNPSRQTEHIREIGFNEEIHNNKNERLNGEIRQREKVMRGLKQADTPILTGYQIFHNFIRTHEALKGKTPAEACGIEIKGDNKWKTLIENASLNHDWKKTRLEDFV
ncbi:MAG: IS6 family transposase [Nitrospiria bacterium]